MNLNTGPIFKALQYICPGIAFAETLAFKLLGARFPDRPAQCESREDLRQPEKLALKHFVK
jgi:hypothetical protein